jgi:hypothetical protein
VIGTPKHYFPKILLIILSPPTSPKYESSHQVF